MAPSIFSLFEGGVGGACSFPSSSTFLNFPSWYSYLPGVLQQSASGGALVCNPSLTSINDIWLVVAAVIEILLRLAALAAFVFIIIGGVKLITSQGDPGALAKARSAILNAVIGLVIAVTAAFLVTFIAQSIK